GAYSQFPKDTIAPEDNKNMDKEFAHVQSTYNSPEFNYSEEKYEGTSFWDRVGKWIRDFFESIIPDFNFNLKEFALYVLYGIGGVAILFTLYRLIFNRQRTVMRTPKEDEDSTIAFIEKN